MIRVSIEVRSGAARFKVAAQAEGIEGTLEMANRYNSGKECKVVFPIDQRASSSKMTLAEMEWLGR